MLRTKRFLWENLHVKVGAPHFKLHLHRTEVVRYPSGHGQDEPIFPLRSKYFYSNFSVEGLEKRNQVTMSDWDPDIGIFDKLVPEITAEEASKPSELITDESIRFKYGSDGRN